MHNFKKKPVPDTSSEDPFSLMAQILRSKQNVKLPVHLSVLKPSLVQSFSIRGEYDRRSIKQLNIQRHQR